MQNEVHNVCSEITQDPSTGYWTCHIIIDGNYHVMETIASTNKYDAAILHLRLLSKHHSKEYALNAKRALLETWVKKDLGGEYEIKEVTLIEDGRLMKVEAKHRRTCEATTMLFTSYSCQDRDFLGVEDEAASRN